MKQNCDTIKKEDGNFHVIYYKYTITNNISNVAFEKQDVRRYYKA